ncbi:AAA family ATPase [Halovenus sp. WSH3]|uniref:AAA family ATPase n=1 Tax=Halovenus carboxidivorans TaxID=2692199 RepID=A0A6B0T691_9EURY|nr:phosphotransacetylase family protein [Halovenus carboxidivorans]MXR50792.1 AAA family ATPase [Halovenus carboxidivorans]
MTRLLVTSTTGGTGKTAITVALGRLAQRRGQTVGYMKPKGTNLESVVGKTRDEDPMLAREVLGLDAGMHQLEPVVYSPTFVQEAIRGRADPDQLRSDIEENFEGLAEGTDLMLLEGSTFRWTGGTVDLTDAEIAELLDADVLLLSGYSEAGDVDEVLAASEEYEDRFAGVLFNDVSPDRYDELVEDAMAFLDGRGVDSYGAIPHDEQLGSITVRELADGIGGELLTPEASMDGRIERFLVGAMSGSGALGQLRRTRNAAVITGGDRSDIQTAAVQASGVRCVILTGGYRPSEAVIGKATSEDVPIILVQSDTRTTIDRTESVLGSGRTRTPEAVERMVELLEESVTAESLLDG